MKSFLKATVAAAALAASAFTINSPARATSFDVGIGVGPVAFDVHSGGFCDRWGCPRSYWEYPIYYGPVFYDGEWFRGPVYYRVIDGEHWYWLHGGWHRDEWRGPRPEWARVYRYWPPQGLDYYRAHGFAVRDEDWRVWYDRDRYRFGEDRYGRYPSGYYGEGPYDQYRDREYPDNERDRYGEYGEEGRSGEHSGYYRGEGYDQREPYEQDRYDNERRQSTRFNEREPSGQGSYDNERRDNASYQHRQPYEQGYSDNGRRESSRSEQHASGQSSDHGPYDHSQNQASRHESERSQYGRNGYDDESGGYSMKRATRTENETNGASYGSHQGHAQPIPTARPSNSDQQGGPYQHIRYEPNESPYGHGQTGAMRQGGSQGATQGRYNSMNGPSNKQHKPNPNQDQNQPDPGY